MKNYLIIIFILLFSCASTNTIIVREDHKEDILGIISDWKAFGAKTIHIDTVKTLHGIEYRIRYTF